MSRLNFDYFSTVLSFETGSASAALTGGHGATDTFDQLLQRAQSQTSPQSDNTDTTPAGQSGREAGPSAASAERSEPSQEERVSTAKKQGGEESAASETASESTETEEAVSESGDSAQDNASRDQSGKDDDADDSLAVVVAAQIQPEPTPVLVDELLLNGEVGAVSTAGPMTEGSEQSLPATDPSIVSMLADSLVDPSAAPTEGQSLPEGQVSGELAGEIAEVLPGQTESLAASDLDSQTAEQASESVLPGQETKSASAATNESSDGQRAAAETATVAAATADGSSQNDGQSHDEKANGRHAQENSETRVASEVVSSSSPHETTAMLEPDPTAELDDGRTDTVEANGKTAATANTTDGEARPSASAASASQSATASHGAGEGDGTGGQVDRVRFVQRVVRAFESAAADGGSVRLRLSPPELGALRLEVTLRNGVMHAHVEAETPAARNLLLDNLPALRDRLAEQNIKVEQFDVDLADQGTSNSWQQPYDREESQPRRAEDDPRPRSQREAAAENTSAARPAPRYGQAGGFDVTI